MKIRIYRGTTEIGGSCVEIVADNNKVLWIDLGLPLSEDNPDISYRHNKVDALLISHPHSDHFGLMESVGNTVPVYIGPVSLELIKATRRFLNLEVPDCNFRTFESWREFRIEDTFTVTPYLVDHSSPEAFAFLIEADGRKIFYTGDFRSSGRKGKLYTRMLANPPKGIDIMLTEGTMVERESQEYSTEAEVQTEIMKIVGTQQNATFVVSSSQNIDRFCSVFTACKKFHKKLIIDVYTAFVLEVVSKKSDKLPTLRTDGMLVYANKSQLAKIGDDHLSDFRSVVAAKEVGNVQFVHPSAYVHFLRCPNVKLVEKLMNGRPVNLIYSQWLGYLTEKHKTYATDPINSLRSRDGIHFNHVHTSGHATMEEILALSNALNPAKIIPIHTSNPEKFKQYFNSHGVDSVETWKDGTSYSIVGS